MEGAGKTQEVKREKKELKDLLKTRYPSVYGDCRRWPCQDGWFGILNVLGERPAWIEQAKGEPMLIMGVNEKFGLLDIDISTTDSEAWAMVAFSGQMSGIICEICGNHGQVLCAGDWLQTRCPAHQHTSSRQADLEPMSYAGSTRQVDW